MQQHLLSDAVGQQWGEKERKKVLLAVGGREVVGRSVKKGFIEFFISVSPFIFFVRITKNSELKKNNNNYEFVLGNYNSRGAIKYIPFSSHSFRESNVRGYYLFGCVLSFLEGGGGT